MKICAIRIHGQLAHWRKWFTTTSALTYSFPPRTAIIGMLGAILGKDRKKLSEFFPIDSTRIAVCPTDRIVKDRIPQNWRQGPLEIVGEKVDPRKINEGFQQNLEVVRYPDYRILFWHKDEALMTELIERLKNKRWFYPPYLGILGFFANVALEADGLELRQRSDKEVILHSVFPLTESEAEELKPSISGSYVIERTVPFDVSPERSFKHQSTVYVPVNGQPLRIRSERELNYFNVIERNQNVVFLEKII